MFYMIFFILSFFVIDSVASEHKKSISPMSESAGVSSSISPYPDSLEKLQSDIADYLILSEQRSDLVKIIPYLEERIKNHKEPIRNHNAVCVYRLKLERNRESLIKQLDACDLERDKKRVSDNIVTINQALKVIDETVSGILLSKQVKLIQIDERIREIRDLYGVGKGTNVQAKSNFFKACAITQKSFFSLELQTHIENPSVESFQNLSVGDKEKLLEQYAPLLVLIEKHA